MLVGGSPLRCRTTVIAPTGGTPHDTGGMTLAEYRAHYSVWAILASPLIISADLRTIKEQHPDCLALMLNPEIVAVRQVSAVFSFFWPR